VNYNWDCAYSSRIVILAEGIDTFKLGPITTAGRIIPSNNLFFAGGKNLWLNGCLGVEPKRVAITLPDGLCDLWGNYFG
jgi:hypothetical protein